MAVDHTTKDGVRTVSFNQLEVGEKYNDPHNEGEPPFEVLLKGTVRGEGVIIFEGETESTPSMWYESSWNPERYIPLGISYDGPTLSDLE